MNPLWALATGGLPIGQRATTYCMERDQNDPPANPVDATEATEEQREMQDQLDDRTSDPEAPAGHQDRHQVSDET